MLLQDVVSSICKATSWKNQSQKEENTVSFELEDGINLNIYSPDGRTVILYDTIAALPNDQYEAKQIVEKYAKHAVAACKTKETVVSLCDNNLILHYDISLKNGDVEINKSARDFLNDLMWWKKKALSF